MEDLWPREVVAQPWRGTEPSSILHHFVRIYILYSWITLNKPQPLRNQTDTPQSPTDRQLPASALSRLSEVLLDLPLPFVFSSPQRSAFWIRKEMDVFLKQAELTSSPSSVPRASVAVVLPSHAVAEALPVSSGDRWRSFSLFICW